VKCQYLKASRISDCSKSCPLCLLLISEQNGQSIQSRQVIAYWISCIIKTKENSASVTGFIDSIPDEQKHKDSYILLKMMEKALKEKPRMWGSSIIGFSNKRYKSLTSGREVDWFKMGLLLVKQISLYTWS
jgi:hypothetical protein